MYKTQNFHNCILLKNDDMHFNFWKQNFISFGSFNLHTNNDLEFLDDAWWVLTPDYTGYHVQEEKSNPRKRRMMISNLQLCPPNLQHGTL